MIIHYETYEPITYPDERRPFRETAYFEVELNKGRGKKVRLDRAEWKILNHFLQRYEFDTRKIKKEDYEHLPKNVMKVIDDWVK